MTALAAHTQCLPAAFGPGCNGIEATSKASGVALDAHEISILLRFGPVQRMTVIHAFAVVEMKPALQRNIPGRAMHLQTTVLHGQQILLQRLDAQRIGDIEIGSLTVTVRRGDVKPVLVAREVADFHIGLQRTLIKVAEYRSVRCRLHGQLMV